ncbi:MAG: zinc carboxypeptidase, partial [Proteobacteria bacterium]|nr:zinc carboxypeptidase [Pseudomonadota bacterium]
MKVMDLGKSQGAIDGTPGFDHRIWGIKVSDNVNTNEPEPGFLFVGEHHARETQTFPVTFAALKNLLENYESDPQIKIYVDTRQIFFIPLCNPDGYTVATTENSMWRKNINSNGYPVSYRSGSYTGVDLNRNYRYKWGENAPNVLTQDTYRGPSIQSEPEVQAVINLADKEGLAASITFHSYSEVILIPFNQESNTEAPVDDAEVRRLAHKMAKVMKNKNGYGTYEVGNAVELLGY